MTSDQYVFELKYKGISDGLKSQSKENPLFVIIDGESMTEFTKLKKDLKKCGPEPFKIQYFDEEDDIISIDTEDEFKEFAKIAKYRSSRGLLIRVILDCNISEDLPIQNSTHQKSLLGMEEAIALENAVQESRDYGTKTVPTFVKDMLINEVGFKELKEKIKSEVKEEILCEMKNKGKGIHPSCVDVTVEDTGYEEDSDGNLFCCHDKRQVNSFRYQHKQERKEKQSDTKYDQRLEKLEMKKKKLLEKASFRASVNRKAAVIPNSLPCIMSVIQHNESSTLAKRVTVGKAFLHVWHFLNDGTLTWTNVELRHTWSSPGLLSDELSVKCPTLTPGQEGQVTVKFKAPKTVGAFTSYWHMFYQMDSQWQQFGHYISVSGNTKQHKLGLSVTAPNKDSKKSKNEIRNVSFHSETDKETLAGVSPNKLILGEDSKLCRRKDVTECLEANLASSEIAAEMAREAANAAIRRASGKQSAAVSSVTTNATVNDGVVEAVQTLNVVDSGSDTEANNDTNEDTDPGFVIVDKTSCTCSDGGNQQTEKVDEMAGDLNPTKEINRFVIVTGNEDFQAVNNEAENVCTTMPSEDRNVTTTNNIIPNELSHEKVDEPQTPLLHPRLDPNVNYPIFPPRPAISIYTPPQPHITHHHGLHAYPIYPTQNSSSHAPCFPPPFSYFATPKVNPPVHYPQMPTYPPMPGSSHPIPLISTGLPPPTVMSAQPAMAPPPQMPPPQMNPAPIRQPVMSHFPITPSPFIRVEYENHLGKTTSADVMNNEPNTYSTNSVISPRTDPVVEKSVKNNIASLETSPTNNATTTTEFSKRKDASSEQKDILEPVETNRGVDVGVQILPQSLVNGAINVASSAYSTAWNALNNLRQKNGDSFEFDPVFENNMALLAEMGFNNFERNAILLKRYNNNVSQVIGILCCNPASEELMNID